LHDDAATMQLLRDVAISHLVTVSPESSLRRAAQVMTDRGVGAAVVVEHERVAGIITERDILHAVARSSNMEAISVGEVMTRDVVSAAPGWTIERAVRTMIEGGFRHLLVCEMDEPVGIVSLRDLMDATVSLLQESEASA